MMQTPTTSQIRNAIEVLKKFGEHMNTNTDNAVIALHDSPQSEQQAARMKFQTMEQTTRIETVAAQLENWRNEQVQRRRQSVSHHV